MSEQQPPEAVSESSKPQPAPPAEQSDEPAVESAAEVPTREVQVDVVDGKATVGEHEYEILAVRAGGKDVKHEKRTIAPGVTEISVDGSAKQVTLRVLDAEATHAERVRAGG